MRAGLKHFARAFLGDRMLFAIQVLQALLVPLLGFLGAYIAWQQMVTARTKLKHDLFDRRFAIFAATRTFLSTILRDARVNDEDMWKYRAGIGEAAFLLSDGLRNYLEQIWKEAVAMKMYHAQLDGVPVGERRSALVEAEHEKLTWLTEQLPVLIECFKPFLQLEAPTRWPSGRNSAQT